MGSFNTSCFVSRQTIAPGDSCMLLPIVQQSTFNPVELLYAGKADPQYGPCNSTCYPNRFWRPVGSYLEVEYSDYGRFVVRDTALNRFRLKQFLREMLRSSPAVAAGENKSHDVPFDLAAFMAENAAELHAHLTERESDTAAGYDADVLFQQCLACWDYVYAVGQEQRLFWLSPQGNPRPLNFAVMHRVAFDELVASTSASVDLRNNSLDMRALFGRALAQVSAQLKEQDATAKSEFVVERNFTQKYFAFETFREEFRAVGSPTLRIPAETVMRNAFHQYLDGKLTEDRLFEILEPWLQERYAYAALEQFNLHFEPIIYTPQDYDNEIGDAYTKFVAKINASVTSALNDRYNG